MIKDLVSKQIQTFEVSILDTNAYGTLMFVNLIMISIYFIESLQFNFFNLKIIRFLITFFIECLF
jgi:hypothetical protein